MGLRFTVVTVPQLCRLFHGHSLLVFTWDALQHSNDRDRTSTLKVPAKFGGLAAWCEKLPF